MDKKASFHFMLLNGQAGIDANDRREMDEMLHTKPKTIVVVFAGGRQTGDKSVCWHVTVNGEFGFLLKEYLSVGWQP